jgi:hypothetical protein
MEVEVLDAYLSDISMTIFSPSAFLAEPIFHGEGIEGAGSGAGCKTQQAHFER